MKAEKIKTYERGLQAENRVALYLRLKGYRILRKRYKTPVGEIDILAFKNRTLVAVEVKARGAESDALEAVTFKNRARVTRALEHFLSANPRFGHSGLRFDVVTYRAPFRFRHLDNAWLAGS
jgi:putative endonuclease